MRQKLTELCDILYGFAFDSAGFTEDSTYPPLVRIRDVKRGYSETNYSGDYQEQYVIHAGDLLIGMDGEFNIARWKSRDALLNQRVCKISAKEGTEEEYLRFALSRALREIENRTAFVTVKHLSAKELNKLELQVPSLSEQNRIAITLRRIEQLIDLRNEELKKYDELIRAQFVEMFGTYPANEKGWDTGTIRDLVTEVRYGSSRKAADGELGKYPYLRMNNITYGGELDLTDTKTIDIPDEELDKCTVRRGDVLFNRTNSKELVGKTCVYNRDEMMVLAGFVVRVRLNDKAYPEFVSVFLNTDFSKQMLLNMCKTAIGQANINAQELQNIGIYIPPKDIQREFIMFKDQVDKSKCDTSNITSATQYQLAS